MKKIFSLILCLLAGAVAHGAEAAHAPAAQAPGTEELMQITRDSRSRLLLITAMVADTPMRMILDTGATHTILHKGSLGKIKKGLIPLSSAHIKFASNTRQRPEMVMGKLQAGPGLSPQHMLVVLDLSSVRSMMGEDVDGIVGMDVLGALPFTFDQKNGQFYWGAPEGAQLCPIRGNMERGGRMMVQAHCGGKELRLLLDTGSAVTRVNEPDWAPGAGEQILARLGNVDSTKQSKMTEGKAGDLDIAEGIILRGVTPLLDAPGHSALLGLDALRGSALIHLPEERSIYGKFYIAR